MWLSRAQGRPGIGSVAERLRSGLQAVQCRLIMVHAWRMALRY